ncbi:NAD(P)H azoreductase-like [Diadema antillarum]|uniref:NAD(P)H azoreductase-like n=1 Tax=Diadema antillarum TaxID=105358 RepID=UPI003A8AFB6B
MGNCGGKNATAPADDEQSNSGDGDGEQEKVVVCVLDCADSVGSATVRALSGKCGDTVSIRGGAKESDKEKVAPLGELPGVTLVTITMTDKASLGTALEGVGVVFITLAPSEDRVDVIDGALEACKEAGVNQVVIASSTSAGLDIAFGKQCGEIESKVKESGIPCTVVRLPLFVDSYMGFKDGIVNQSKICCPVDPQKSHCPVLVDDVGKAASAIMSSFEKHADKTYNLVGPRHSYGELVDILGEVLEHKIEYERVPYESSKQSLINAGMDDWQAAGVVEVMQLIDEGAPEADIAETGDFKSITGEEPTELKIWVTSVKSEFQAAE